MNLPTEELTIESVLRDYGISDEERRSIPPKIIEEFVGGFIPTKEDLERRLSEEDLIELCKRVRCRVLMSRWNAVDDYVRGFRREGRLQNKTREKAHKLLAKAVNRHKAAAVYTEEDSWPVREREWRERKKENLLRLDLWAYDRQQLELEQREQRELLQQREQIEQATQEHIQGILDDVMHSSSSLDGTKTLASNNTPLDTSATDSIIEVASYVTVPSTAKNLEESLSVELPLGPALNLEAMSERSKEMALELQGFMEINTESMSMSFETPVLSQCTPAYEDFNSLIGPTSTQSQRDK